MADLFNVNRNNKVVIVKTSTGSTRDDSRIVDAIVDGSADDDSAAIARYERGDISDPNRPWNKAPTTRAAAEVDALFWPIAKYVVAGAGAYGLYKLVPFFIELLGDAVKGAGAVMALGAIGWLVLQAVGAKRRG